MTIPPTAEFVIQTTSEQIQSWSPSGTAPKITVNGAPFAQLSPPEFPSGYQVVVMDAAGDLTNPDNIILNIYIQLQNDGGNWGSTYQFMYSQMVNAVLNAGNIDLQLLLVASFGLDLAVPPTNDGLQLLLTRGAGSDLQAWDLVPDPGSQGSGWVGNPASYILLGGSGYSYGGGSETFVAGNPAPATLTVTLNNNVPPSAPPEQAAAAAT
jgi:hypothetical protein